MEDIKFIEVFLLAQILGLCVYRLSDKLGSWAIGFGVLTPPITFALVLCARWNQIHPASVTANRLEESLNSALDFFFWTVTLLFGVGFNFAGALVTIFLTRKLAPASPLSALEK
ncbi:MAG: hypothetical protein JST84_07740 [Acidobacteria bacterium]|nr:hypothetical protein [Acidobacteriota bacterium]